MKKSRTYALTECALALALSFALSYIKVIQLPFEGAVTLLSMLPICLISIKHGVLWGLGTAFCYSWLQILQGGVFAWGLTPLMLFGSLVFDFFLAFTPLGLAGLFRRRGTVGCVLGVAMVCAIRFLSHFLSGVILWAELDAFVAFGQEWISRPGLYSLCYNGIYMLPETVFTTVGALILLRIPEVKRLFSPQ